MARPSCVWLFRLRHRLSFVILTSLSIASILGAILAIVPKQAPIPLVPKDSWKIAGQFFSFPNSAVSAIDVQAEILSDLSFTLWRSWSPTTNGTIGSVKTVGFLPPRYIAIPFHGFPGEYPGNRIFLRCISSGAEIEVAVARTNTQWATAYLKIPALFCPSEVELVASNADIRSYVGIGTPFSTGALSYFAHTTIFPVLFIVISTWAIFCLIGFAASILLYSRVGAPLTTTAFVAVGIVAMAVFTIFSISPRLGNAIVWLLIGGSTAISIAAYLNDRHKFISIAKYNAPPAMVWLIISFAYASLSVAADNGGGSWTVNHLFAPLRWSADNQLPFLFAEALFEGTPGRLITWGPWLASDRPPLLAALLLIPRTAIISPVSYGIGSDFIPLAYQSAAITLLSAWSLVIYQFCMRWSHRHANYVITIAFFTSFFLFNTIYIWPKILGAAYVLIAFDLLLRIKGRDVPANRALTFVSLAAAFAYLSHGSNSFALLPLAIAFAPTILRCGTHSILIAAAAGIVSLLPWLWWQGFVQPHGNALIRFALANDFGFNNRTSPISTSIYVAYQKLGWNGWISAKLDGLRLLSGLRDDWKSFGEVALQIKAADKWGPWRVLDFFSLTRSLGVAVIGLLLLLLATFQRSKTSQIFPVKAAAVIGLSGILLASIIMLPPPITHQQAYGSILLLFCAGALMLSRSNPIIRHGTFVVALLYSITAWVIDPLHNALRVDFAAIVSFSACSIWIFLRSPPIDQSSFLKEKLNVLE